MEDHPTRCSHPSLLLLALAAWLPAADASAAVTLTGDEEVVIASHEVVDDDLIVWATYVRVDGVVKGDVVAFGQDVVVEGVVEGDLIAVGKTVYLNGSVGDDARLLAYAVALGEKAGVADDLFDLSYSLDLRPGSQLGGTLYAACVQALLAGAVAEDLWIRTGALVLAGLTGGDVHAVVGDLEDVPSASLAIDLSLEIPEVPEGLSVAGSAAIGGDLEHRSPEPARIADDARIGGAVLHERIAGAAPSALPDREPERPDRLGERGRDALERLATLLVLGLALAVAIPGWLRDRADAVRVETIGMLGFGLVAVIFTGLVAAMLGVAFGVWMVLGLSTGTGSVALAAIVFGGLVQTAIAALFCLALFYLGPVLASAGLGRALVARFRPAELAPVVESALNGMLTVSLGAVLYTLLRALPWLGPLVAVVGALVGLGALAAWLRDLFQPFDRPAQPIASERKATSGS